MVGHFNAVAESLTTQTVFQVHRACLLPFSKPPRTAHSASFNVTFAGLRGKFGPRIAVNHATQPVQGNGEICVWAHSFWL